MATETTGLALLKPVTQFVAPKSEQVERGDTATIQENLTIGADFVSQTAKLPAFDGVELKVGLIDCYRLNRECLAATLESQNQRIAVIQFESIRECIEEINAGLDLIIYYPHGGDAAETAVLHDVAAIRQIVPALPIVVLSDVDEAQQPKIIRSMLGSGAHGFIPTRTTGISITLAAMRFVKAGGTFAPVDQLLTTRPEREVSPAEDKRPHSLTARQMAVLSHLQQGKANKIIAYELDMSESTVKVHVRNIMRKMGATNRTQAAYKARQWSTRPGGNQVAEV